MSSFVGCVSDLFSINGAMFVAAKLTIELKDGEVYLDGGLDGPQLTSHQQLEIW